MFSLQWRLNQCHGLGERQARMADLKRNPPSHHLWDFCAGQRTQRLLSLSDEGNSPFPLLLVPHQVQRLEVGMAKASPQHPLGRSLALLSYLIFSTCSNNIGSLVTSQKDCWKAFCTQEQGNSPQTPGTIIHTHSKSRFGCKRHSHSTLTGYFLCTL